MVLPLPEKRASRSQATAAQIERARELYCSGTDDIEVYDEAVVVAEDTSKGADAGTWIQAWLWLPDATQPKEN